MVKVKFIKTNITDSVDKNSIELELADFEYKNSLQFPNNRGRALDGTLLKEANCYYIVQVRFMIANMSLTDYSRFVQIVNAPSFFMECYDYEICKYVHREMALANYSRNRLLATAGAISNIIGVELDAEGMQAFKNYEELMSSGLVSESVRWI